MANVLHCEDELNKIHQDLCFPSSEFNFQWLGDLQTTESNKRQEELEGVGFPEAFENRVFGQTFAN